MKYKAVLFDMDGVIFDTERLYLECCGPAAEKFGFDGIEDACLQCVGLTDEATHQMLYEIYGQDAPLEDFFEEAVRVFMARYEAEGLRVKTGVREILTWLHENKIPTALASSTEIDIVKEELAGAGLDTFFDVIVGGDMAERSKPAPDIFLKAAELLGCDPSDCIVIEDSYNGIRAAAAAGTKPIMVPDLLPPTDEMRTLAVVVRTSLLDVLDDFKTGVFEETDKC